MTKSIFLSICILLCLNSISKAQSQEPKHIDSLYSLMYSFREDTTAFDRLKANYRFIEVLVQSLKQNSSYNLSYDTLKALSVLKDEKDKFRIFTWHVKLEKATFRHFGCIQVNDESLKLFPFMDYSDSLSLVADTILSEKCWLGATYYQLKSVKRGGKNYHMLMGFDPHEPFSNKKVIDVLWFEKDGSPKFGAPIFQTDDGIKNRVVFEYKKDANFALGYSEDEKGIIYENLIPSDSKFEGMYFNYVPDGSYDKLYWKKGMWKVKENVILGK